MKRIVFFGFLFLLFRQGYGQLGEWAWMSGDTLPNSAGVFGTQGIGSSSNKPPGLYEALQWTDKQGNFWLFGGAKASGIEMSDLWKFDPVANQWTWVKGPGIPNQSGIYGTLGLPSPTNNPGARGWGAISWRDTSNNLWLWGGEGYDGNGNGGYLNDLWRYDIALNEWTWMSGANATYQLGVYGTKGSPASGNCPGGRQETSASWVDKNNNLWLFGGQGRSTSLAQGRLNDLWKYDIAANQWTWMNGTNLLDQPGVYGSLNVPSASNTPGGRWPYCAITDTLGNFWLIGGEGVAANNSIGNLNDIWKYHVTTNEWEWVGGPDTASNSGNYGTQCKISLSNQPPCRHENKACWLDKNGNIWMFGGQQSTDGYNDLWRYSLFSKAWTWVSGDNFLDANSVYGTYGMPAPGNHPSNRAGAISWTGSDGSLWLFGGVEFTSVNYLGDMWRFVPDPNCLYELGVKELSPIVNLELYPNPARNYCRITFSIENTEKVSISIVDVCGREVYSQYMGDMAQGKHEIEITLQTVLSGIYLCKLSTTHGIGKALFVKED